MGCPLGECAVEDSFGNAKVMAENVKCALAVECSGRFSSGFGFGLEERAIVGRGSADHVTRGTGA